MEQRKEELSRKPPYVYTLPEDVLSNLQRKEETTSAMGDYTEADLKVTGPSIEETFLGATGSKTCSLCNAAFSSVEDQRGHVRSDLHIYNLKQKLRGLQAVSEEEFEKLVEDLDESLSGSDSSDSDDEEQQQQGHRKETVLSSLLKKQAERITEVSGDAPVVPVKTKPSSGTAPLLWFSSAALPPNIYLGIYRALFTSLEQESESQLLDAIVKKQISPDRAETPNNTGRTVMAEIREAHIFLCMIGGGHFAAMIVSLVPKLVKSSIPGPPTREVAVIAHKTFHRYTTRRKQGGAQSANDAAKGAAHSAGSSLRRYNEAALTDEVRLLLSDWRELIGSSELLFVRATGNTNRRTLFGPYDGQVLRTNDSRLRGFPFTTRRATQSELIRSFVELTRVKVREREDSTVDYPAKQVETQKLTKELAPKLPKRSEEEETAILHSGQIQALIRRSKMPALLSYLKTNSLSADILFYPGDSQQNHHASTPLHLAASLNLSVMVLGLLTKANANPLPPNGDGKTAFDLAGDRATRDAFRVARLSVGEDRWDWAAAHVPSALSKSDAEERDVRERQDTARKEDERRKAEAERLKLEGPKVGEDGPLGKAASKGRTLALGHAQKTAQERREEESRGLTPEMRAKLERERRARAAEERITRLQNGN